MDYFELEKSEKGIASLHLNVPDEKVNVLKQGVLLELADYLEDIDKDESIKGLLLSSAKPGCFIAGADIQELSAIQGEAEAYKLCRQGQLVIHRISTLKVPTLAVIEGACLGGGLELALACDKRIVSDHAKTQLGLPEVRLGIIPGFGGTQRLPRIIGCQKALDMILTGRAIGAKKAKKMGLVDKLVPSALLREKAIEMMHAMVQMKGRSQRGIQRTKGLLNTTFLGRSVLFRISKKALLKQTKGHYPAPLAALNLIKKTCCMSLEKGLELEAKAFSRVSETPVSKTLIQLFFTQEALKKQGKKEAGLKPITSVGILGAGLMGGGIAWAVSEASLSVRLKDLNWGYIAKAFETAAGVYKSRLKRRRIKPFEVTLKMAKLSGTTNYAGFSHLDTIIEAVPEDMGLKKRVYAELESQISESTLIASNTSALSITELATGLKKPDRFLGVHFFSPVHKMPLVELIPGKETSQDAVQQGLLLCKKIKKIPIIVKDCPGFLINRILLPYVNEAVLLLEEGGASVSDIDQLMVAFGMPIGPFALADEVGLDVGIKVSQLLEDGYGERMTIPTLFKEDFKEKNMLGRKTGGGFYCYKHANKRVNTRMLALINSPARKTYSNAYIIDRLVLRMVNEAALCLDEEVVESAAFLDMAMLMGTGFPPFRGGLLRYADSLGISKVCKDLEVLEKERGLRYKPSKGICDLAARSSRYYD